MNMTRSFKVVRYMLLLLSPLLVCGLGAQNEKGIRIKDFVKSGMASDVQINPVSWLDMQLRAAQRAVDEYRERGENVTETDLNRVRLYYLGVLQAEYQLAQSTDSRWSGLSTATAARANWTGKEEPTGYMVEQMGITDIASGIAKAQRALPDTRTLQSLRTVTVPRDTKPQEKEVEPTSSPRSEASVQAPKAEQGPIQIEPDFIPPNEVLFVIRNTGNSTLEVVGPSESRVLNKPQTYWIEAVDSTGTSILASLPQAYGDRNLHLDSQSVAKLEKAGFARGKDAPVDATDPSWRIARIPPGGSDRIVVNLKDWFPNLSPGAIYDVKLKVRPSESATVAESAAVAFKR